MTKTGLDMRRRVIAALLLPVAMAATTVAQAERADRNKPTLLEGAQCTTDELKQVSICSGSVVLVRGSLRITGERLEVREDPEGYRQATVIAAPGSLATFRQRQDASRPGVEEFVEGAAERIEYDERAETVRLIQRAQWKRLENEQPRDEVSGSLITYDSRNSSYNVDGGRADSDGRVRLILAPRSGEGSPAPAEPPPPLTPAPGVRPAPGR